MSWTIEVPHNSLYCRVMNVDLQNLIEELDEAGYALGWDEETGRIELDVDAREFIDCIGGTTIYDGEKKFFEAGIRGKVIFADFDQGDEKDIWAYEFTDEGCNKFKGKIQLIPTGFI